MNVFEKFYFPREDFSQFYFPREDFSLIMRNVCIFKQVTLPAILCSFKSEHVLDSILKLIIKKNPSVEAK